MAVTSTRPVAIKIDEDIKIRIKNLAEARNRTSHWLMREAIIQFVEREEKRESFRHDTLMAWEAYRARGLYASANEVDTWLNQLEQGNDIEPPEYQS